MTTPKKKAPKLAAVTTEPPAPGEAGFDWQAQYPGEEVFVFTASDGRTVGLARISEKRRPKPGMLRQLRKQHEAEQMYRMIEFVACDAALEVSDDFDDTDYARMYNDYLESLNTTAGESSRSSDA